MAYNKVIYGSNTLMNLCDDTVTAAKVLSGYTAHDKQGASITGTCDYDCNTSDGTATAVNITKGKTAYVNGSKITGTNTFDADTSDATAAASDIASGVTAYVGGSKITGTNTYDADTSDATATAQNISSGKTAYVNGFKVTGTNTYDANTSDATAEAADLLSGETAYVNGSKITGSMSNRGAVTGTISTKAGTYTIPAGYHNGSGSVSISQTEQDKLISSNIKSGITILGVSGNYTGDAGLDTSDATAEAADILYGESAYVNGSKIVGNMPNNGTVTGTISTKAGTYTIPKGYHSGSGTVSISSTEQSKIIASNIKSGVSILGVSGTYEGDAGLDTSDATALASEILSGATAYVDGAKVTGTMTNNSAVTGTISTKTGSYTIPAGYHNGSGKVTISTTEQNKIIASNIKNGVTILGITGSYEGTSQTGLDTSDATATSSDILSGKTAYVNGEKITGTNTYDADTSDGTATASDILSGKIAYVDGSKVTGTNTYDADTQDATATSSDILSGKTAYVAGTLVTGKCTYDADTSSATAAATQILSGYTAYVDGSKITGSMTNRGAVTGTISTKAGSYTIAAGYHNGQGKVTISSTEQSKIIASNIKSGVSILGVSGTYSGLDTSDATAEAADILSGETAYVNGSLVTGTLEVQTFYTGTDEPDATLGSNGDLYFVTG